MESAAKGQDPFAVECILHGLQQRHHRVSSIAVHGEKLYVGSSSGSLSIYRLPSATSSPLQSSSKAQHISTHPAFHPANKAVSNLRILAALSIILSSCPDRTIYFNNLATLEPIDPPAPVKALPTKSIVTFEVQTTVVDWPKEPSQDAQASVAIRASSRAKLDRSVGADDTVFCDLKAPASGIHSNIFRPLSLFQQQDPDASHLSRPGLKLNLRLVTTLVVSVRRRILVLRWLDRDSWDFKEITLAHTPRAMAFAPTAFPASQNAASDPKTLAVNSSTVTLFLSHGTTSEFGVLKIPPAYTSSAIRQQDSKQAPPGLRTYFAKDDTQWAKVEELNIPEYAGKQVSAANQSAAREAGHSRSGIGVGEVARSTAGGFAMGNDQSRDATIEGTAASAPTAGAFIFSGLGNYIGLGGRTKAPMLRAVPGNAHGRSSPADSSFSDPSGTTEPEVVVVRENTAIFLSFLTGNPTRRRGLEWAGTIDDVALLPSGHIFAAIPVGGSTKQILQARSTRTFEIVQSISFPQADDSMGGHTISSLFVPQSSASASAGSSLFVVLTPSSSNESSKIYRLTPRPWKSRLREMIRARRWLQAAELVRKLFNDGQDEEFTSGQGSDESTGVLNEKFTLLPPLLALLSLERFLAACVFAQKKQMHSAHQSFEAAVEQWIDLELNPSKVLSIFPESIAGKGLSKPRREWIKIWGAELERAGFPLDDAEPERPSLWTDMSRRSSTASSIAVHSLEGAVAIPRDRSRLTGLLGRVSRPNSIIDTAGLSSSPKPESTGASASGEQKAAPISNVASCKGSPMKESGTERPPLWTTNQAESLVNRSANSSPAPHNPADVMNIDTESLLLHPSLEALGRFLADRRRIFKPILEDTPPVRPTPHDDIAMIPSVPLSSLSPEDLTALAQVVDTALFKTFLETKPSLVGPLCRIQNWCEVNEVEELLEARGKHSELINLYGGKGMHDRALKLLRKFADEEEGEKVGPTIRYLQNLGPQHIEVILENARWVLAENPQRGMEIFTADTGKVSSLPRLNIVNLLSSLDRNLCAQYLEHIIHNVGDGDPELHEKLALIYLEGVRGYPEDLGRHERLLRFLSESQQYRPERLLTQVPPDGLWEVRAVLLGKMGQHRAALDIYVEHIGGEEGERKAEAYCAKVYEAAETEEDRQIFLLLFKLYLRPAEAHIARESEVTGQAPLMNLGPALRLLAQRASSLNLSAVLDLLPPLVPLSSISHFLTKGLQASHRHAFGTSVIASIFKERDVQLDESVKYLQSRRVKVTQGKTCPICSKRIGVSVIAVTHRGEVLHYGCRQQQ